MKKKRTSQHNRSRVLTREQVRSLDKIAIESFGISGLVLMENAGRSCALEAVSMLGGAKGGEVAIFCGKGNNGGDGFVVARHLSNNGAAVRVFLTTGACKVLRRGGDAAVNLNIILKMGLQVTEITDKAGIKAAVEDSSRADLIVDALLGTGTEGEVRGLFCSLICAINEVGRPVLGVDLPSGLDCDTGLPLGCAVRCSRTVTFVMPKRGFQNPESIDYTGEVKVADIGIPRKLVIGMFTPTRRSRSRE